MAGSFRKSRKLPAIFIFTGGERSRNSGERSAAPRPGGNLVSVTIHVPLDSELAGLLQMFDKPVGDTARELIVLELYRQGRVSSGKAAHRRLSPRRGRDPGVLLRAKHAGLIDKIRPRLEKLEELPFHIAPRLREMVLRDAGE